MPHRIRDLTRRQACLLIGVLVGVLALGVGSYGLIAPPGHPGPGTIATTPIVQRRIAQPDEVASVDPALIRLTRTNDPISYARSVATALFDWDTASGYLPSDYLAAVFADADPSGEETAGLITDVATYLPTTAQWLDLARMNVTQRITISSATVPADWQSIAARSHGELHPGTTAVTITGTRHRTGDWDGQPASSSTPISFTVFLACRPSFARCHVLRLSQLDKPLT